MNFSRWISRLWGPAGSVLLHVLLVALLVKMVVFRAPPKEEVPVELAADYALELDQDRPDPEPPAEEPDESALEVEQVEELLTELPQPEAEQEPVCELPDQLVSDAQSPPVEVQNIFSGRTAEAREKLLKKYAGEYAVDVDKAVLKALDWLQSVQHPAGFWGPEQESMTRLQERARLTGLALMTFLAHGETPQSEAYGATVQRALDYLLAAQQEDGRFCPFSELSRPSSADDIAVYGHAIATYALCETYALTRSPALKKPLRRALRVMVEGQQPGGGWDHRYQKAKWSDLSVAGWQIQALNAARAAGLYVPGLEEALTRAVSALAAHHKGDGVFYYRIGIKNPVAHDYMTGVAVLCLQLMGKQGDPLLKKGLDYLREVQVLDWTAGWRKTAASRSFNMAYEWYYNTQAVFQQGGAKWKSWNAHFAPMLIGAQSADGAWREPAAGKSDAGADTVNITAYSALSLQVYYRILPGFSRAEAGERPPQHFEDRIQVDVVRRL
jgi:hypothetical protein